jgi:hypothetical protein
MPSGGAPIPSTTPTTATLISAASAMSDPDHRRIPRPQPLWAADVPAVPPPGRPVRPWPELPVHAAEPPALRADEIGLALLDLGHGHQCDDRHRGRPADLVRRPSARAPDLLPTSVIAATIGVWLFYVQHQFEETHWSKGEDWQLHDAALEGSSHYILPQPLRWFSGNIGIHHVHHLYSRIPFYRLPEVIRDHRALAEAQRLTIRESLRTGGPAPVGHGEGKLMSFKEARMTRSVPHFRSLWIQLSP